MEGAAIAHGAYLNQIPCVIVRAISDKADNSASMDYPAFEKESNRTFHQVVRETFCLSYREKTWEIRSSL